WDYEIEIDGYSTAGIFEESGFWWGWASGHFLIEGFRCVLIFFLQA
ncbi:18479_t:CDS:2, partial [Gigaspora rosea]